MARARNIKPSIMDNEDLAALEPVARLLFIYLWMLADKAGRLEDRPARIRKQALGYDNVDIESLLQALANGGFILRYEIEGNKLIQIVSFQKHQTPHVREQDSTLPGPNEVTAKEETKHNPGGDKPLPRSPDSLIPDSLIPDTGLSDSFCSPEVEPNKRTRFVKPTLDQIREYCHERGNEVDPERWFDHYTSNGWKVGKNPMADWKATVRTWEKGGNGQNRQHYEAVDNSAPAKVRRAIAEQERQERHRREREI